MGLGCQRRLRHRTGSPAKATTPRQDPPVATPDDTCAIQVPQRPTCAQRTEWQALPRATPGHVCHRVQTVLPVALVCGVASHTRAHTREPAAPASGNNGAAAVLAATPTLRAPAQRHVRRHVQRCATLRCTCLSRRPNAADVGREGPTTPPASMHAIRHCGHAWRGYVCTRLVHACLLSQRAQGSTSCG